jgi:outer membrane protein
MRYLILILGLLLSTVPEQLCAQKILSLDSALQRALVAGHGILIAQSELQAAELQDYRGNAGETPRTAFTLNDNAQLINTNQSLANGSDINRVGAVANNFGAALNVNWTIFNGMRVKATKSRIHAQVEQSTFLLRASIQATVADLMQAYYTLARQQGYLDVIEQSRLVSEKRLELTQQRKLAGLANGADLLLAEIDLHEREQAAQTQAIVQRQFQIDLSNAMQGALDENWVVADEFPLEALNWADIETGILQNPELSAADAAVRAAEASARSAYANRMPTIQVNGGLAYNLAFNNGGFVLQNQNYGPYVGLNANVPLLQRRIFDRQYKIAQQQAETTRLRQAQTEDELLAMARKLFESHVSLQEQALKEVENVGRARQLFEIVVQREQLDAATVLELREAQRSFEEANFRLIDLKYQALMAQVELMRLAGMLVQ